MKPVIVAAAFMAAVCCLGAAFQGGITVAVSQGGQTRHLLYTVGTNSLRVECTDAGYPYPRDIVNMRSGAIIILFPNNRSFMKLPGKSPAPSGSPMSRIGPMPVPGAPAMPMIPRPAEPLELKATGRTTNILGYACASYELINRAEVMDIWATKELPPFQPYLQGQPPVFGAPVMTEQWGQSLKMAKLFPLEAILKFENGRELYRFQVTNIQKMKIKDAALFRPPPHYNEIQPMPF